MVSSSFWKRNLRLREVDDLASHTAGKDGVGTLTSGQLNSNVRGHFSTSNCRANTPLFHGFPLMQPGWHQSQPCFKAACSNAMDGQQSEILDLKITL